MEFNKNTFVQYKNLIETTEIQACYQQIIKLINYIYLNLKQNLPAYAFTNRIVENRMNFTYFQATNKPLKKLGLKIQVVFIHKSCTFEVWMSGYNRKIQHKYYQSINFITSPFEICANPDKNDYIVKAPINKNITVDDVEIIIDEITNNIENLEVFFLNHNLI